MQPGDLVSFHATDGSEVPVLVLGIAADVGSVKVLLRGAPIWVPEVSVAPMQPGADRGMVDT